MNTDSRNGSEAERYLVTGALGCIGSWVVRNLIHDGSSPVIFDLDSSQHRLHLILNDDELSRAKFVRGDITDLASVERALDEHGITHIIHLAALQVPFCRVDPPRGALVNVVGTVNLFEAAKKRNLTKLVYASSIAVYGRDEEYHEMLTDDARQRPNNLYGVYKQANEGTARIYWQDSGIASIGLRPHTVYGPGRDQGMTSDPTKAMLAAAAGKPYRIGFGGRAAYQYVDDAARIFIQAARSSFEGAEVYNLRGNAVDMSEVVRLIETAAPDVAGKITLAETSLRLPDSFDDHRLAEAIGQVPNSPLEKGIQQTIDIFREGLRTGLVSANS